MTDAAALPLYPSEAQIARRVLGVGRVAEWNGLAVVLERQGLPAIDPQFGGRYWPAVELWFQARNRLATVRPGQMGKQDGGETCPTPRKKPQDLSGGPAATVHRLHTGEHQPSSSRLGTVAATTARHPP